MGSKTEEEKEKPNVHVESFFKTPNDIVQTIEVRDFVQYYFLCMEIEKYFTCFEFVKEFKKESD